MEGGDLHILISPEGIISKSILKGELVNWHLMIELIPIDNSQGFYQRLDFGFINDHCVRMPWQMTFDFQIEHVFPCISVFKNKGFKESGFGSDFGIFRLERIGSDTIIREHVSELVGKVLGGAFEILLFGFGIELISGSG
jgi:hypothetical protein